MDNGFAAIIKECVVSNGDNNSNINVSGLLKLSARYRWQAPNSAQATGLKASPFPRFLKLLNTNQVIDIEKVLFI